MRPRKVNDLRRLGWLVFSATLPAVWVGELFSSMLSVWGLHLFLLGLWVSYPAIYLSFGTGLLVVLAAGFWLDVSTPWPLGTQALLGAVFYIILQAIRHKLNEDFRLPFVRVALVLNGLSFLALALLQSQNSFFILTYWKSIIINFFVSEGVVLLLAPLWLKLMDRLSDLNRKIRKEKKI